MSPIHVERAGSDGPVVMLVHGSGAPGWGTFAAQRPLERRFHLVLPHRSGYPPNPPLERIDFEMQAAEIAEIVEPGSHLVGHSYGGVVALLAAGQLGGRLASLTVIEPPAFDVARGVAAVEELISGVEAIVREEPEPRGYAARFAKLVGSTFEPPDPLPPPMEAIIRASMVERPPWEADLPLEAVRRSGIPVLVVSGAHSPAFDAVCDVLTHELDGERAVLPGSNHSVQRTGQPFNDVLAAFVEHNL